MDLAELGGRFDVCWSCQNGDVEFALEVGNGCKAGGVRQISENDGQIGPPVGSRDRDIVCRIDDKALPAEETCTSLRVGSNDQDARSRRGQ